MSPGQRGSLQGSCGSLHNNSGEPVQNFGGVEGSLGAPREALETPKAVSGSEAATEIVIEFVTEFVANHAERHRPCGGIHKGKQPISTLPFLRVDPTLIYIYICMYYVLLLFCSQRFRTE